MKYFLFTKRDDVGWAKLACSSARAKRWARCALPTIEHDKANVSTFIKRYEKLYEEAREDDNREKIASIDQAEALFRNSLESLDSNIPVLILGSKQHLLNQIFAKPNALFYNWGTHILFSLIDYPAYREYMNERFAQFGLKINLENATYLQDLMSRNPEAINRLCYQIQVSGLEGEIQKETIESALDQLIESRRSEPESYLSSFSTAEQRVIINLAHYDPIRYKGQGSHCPVYYTERL